MNKLSRVCKALSFCRASTVFLSKTAPFLAVPQQQDPRTNELRETVAHVTDGSIGVEITRLVSYASLNCLRSAETYGPSSLQTSSSSWSLFDETDKKPVRRFAKKMTRSREDTSPSPEPGRCDEKKIVRVLLLCVALTVLFNMEMCGGPFNHCNEKMLGVGLLFVCILRCNYYQLRRRRAAQQAWPQVVHREGAFLGADVPVLSVWVCDYHTVRRAVQVMLVVQVTCVFELSELSELWILRILSRLSPRRPRLLVCSLPSSGITLSWRNSRSPRPGPPFAPVRIPGTATAMPTLLRAAVYAYPPTRIP